MSSPSTDVVQPPNKIARREGGRGGGGDGGDGGGGRGGRKGGSWGDNRKSSRPEGTSPVEGFVRHPKRKLALLLGYQGAAYYGLQRQKDLPTVELELEKALTAANAVAEPLDNDLSRIGWSRSARTDKRVSAARTICAAKLQVEGDDVQALVARMNAALPADIRVFDAVKVTKGFNAKKACDRRNYKYLLPSALLAPPEIVDAAFAARGLDEERIERFRQEVLDTKKRAALGQVSQEELRSRTWQLSDEDIAAVAASLAAWRSPPEVVARLREVLGAYKGTRHYHNFTSRMKGDDPSGLRYMISFDASDPFIPAGAGAGEAETEWLLLTVVGQSFILHQIRKMVAVASHATRTGRFTDAESAGALITALCSPEDDVALQLVPGDGLYLGEPIFDAYNELKAAAAGRDRLQWVEGHPAFDAIEAFRVDVIESAIVKNGASAALAPWVEYLWQVKLFGFPLSPQDKRLAVNEGSWRFAADSEDDAAAPNDEDEEEDEDGGVKA